MHGARLAAGREEREETQSQEQGRERDMKERRRREGDCRLEAGSSASFLLKDTEGRVSAEEKGSHQSGGRRVFEARVPSGTSGVNVAVTEW